MKNLFYILLMAVPFISIGQTNFSTYGATGDGIADDTAEIQAALDSGNDLVADEGSTFFISSTLDIDQSGNQSIDWNGSALTTNSGLNPMINIAKLSGGGTTTMLDLVVDANLEAQRGIIVKTPVNFTNIDVSNFLQSTSASPVGIWIDIENDMDAFGAYILDGCDISDFEAVNNNTITDSQGAGYCMYVTWDIVPSIATTITVKNATMENSFGEDANIFYIFNSSGANDIGSSTSHFYGENLILKNGERRIAKLFSSGQTWTNCTFMGLDDSDERATSTQPSAGLLEIGAYNNENITFENCTFNGNPTGTAIDDDIRITDAGDIHINNSHFINGANLKFKGIIGDVWVCNTDFGPNSLISDFLENSDAGQITFDSGNNYTEPTIFNGLEFFSYTIEDLDCAVDEPTTPIVTIRPWQLKLNGKSVRLQLGTNRIN